VPKKPKKPRIRRSKEWKKRSEASKKGWKARKLKKSILDTRRRLPGIIDKLPDEQRAKILPRAKPLPGLSTPVNERIEELEARIKELEYLNSFISDNAEPEYKMMNGMVAVNPSWFRCMGNKFKHDVLEMLTISERDGHLAEHAIALAEHYNVSLKEVYSFFYSP
jgi:hypothetical protein